MTGRFPRYEYPKWFRDAIQAHGREQDKAPAHGVSQLRFLARVLDQWDRDVSLDLQQFFGIDILDAATLDRPWWWLRTRLFGLLDVTDSRLYRWVTDQTEGAK